MTYRDFWQPLVALYGADEARAIARLVMERRFGLSMTDIVMGAVETLDEAALSALAGRLLTGEPVQYVLGTAVFCGRSFQVSPGVLIPRPETEWLCHRAAALIRAKGTESGTAASCNCLDIGTGSGCIACTLALEGASEVVAWDLSERAVAIARSNASALGARVRVARQDALSPPDDRGRWDLVVSNPPYVCEKERPSMHTNVVCHEPWEALFVPDADPLLFYRAIGRYALSSLKPGGTLLLEFNPLFAAELQALLTATGFSRVALFDDVFGKCRFAEAQC